MMKANQRSEIGKVAIKILRGCIVDGKHVEKDDICEVAVAVGRAVVGSCRARYAESAKAPDQQQQEKEPQEQKPDATVETVAAKPQRKRK